MNIKEDKQLSSSMEDYLEAIIILKRRNGVARVRDIGQFLDVKTPSVNSALKTLSQKGYVDHERYGYIELTKDGENLAKDVLTKHNTITSFLVDVLNVEETIAKEDACKIEHIISSHTLNKLNEFITKFKNPKKARGSIK